MDPPQPDVASRTPARLPLTAAPAEPSSLMLWVPPEELLEAPQSWTAQLKQTWQSQANRYDRLLRIGFWISFGLALGALVSDRGALGQSTSHRCRSKLITVDD